jgi:hypothetical protein
MTEALLEGGEVEFGGGREMQFLDCGQKALQYINDEAVANKIGIAAYEGVHARGGRRKPGVEIKLMESEAELDVRAGGEQSLPDEGNGMIECGSGRKRATVGDVEFLEDCEPAWTQMVLEFAKGVDRIGISHEDKPANDGIERLVESDFGGIAFEEAGIAETTELGAGNGPLKGGRDAIGADDFAAGADEIGDEEGDVTSSTANFEDPHAGVDSGLL